MKTLRQIHLYLGCIFAPLIVFFSVSGVWQTLGISFPSAEYLNRMLLLLSTIHTGRGVKGGEPPTLSSPAMEVVVILMSICLIATIVLGVMLAFKFGKSRVALTCLVAGTLIPALLVLVKLF